MNPRGEGVRQAAGRSVHADLQDHAPIRLGSAVVEPRRISPSPSAPLADWYMPNAALALRSFPPSRSWVAGPSTNLVTSAMAR